MENRQHGIPQLSVWPACARPLSDIRELTEPSLLDAMSRKPKAASSNHTNVSRRSSFKRAVSLKRRGSVKIVEPSTDSGYRFEVDDSDSSYDSAASIRDTSSLYSIPFSSVPVRASSQTREATRTLRSTTLKASPTLAQRPRDNTVIPNRGQSRSPVRQAGPRHDTVSSQTSRRIPSQTFVRKPPPRDILDFPTHRHPRIGVDFQVAAPLFVGGGSIEGCVRVVVDDAERIRDKMNLTIGRLAVDLIGIEETSANRKSIFLSLGTELLDLDHPPPKNMIDPANRHASMDSFWTLVPSFTSIPFMISLPLDTGPPPFHSKNARIRFVLSTTLLVKDSGRQYLVRCSQDIAVLSTYDPEKALRSLPSPLTACDETTCSKSGTVESTKVTAGLHRQVWVSGSTIFADIHIANNSRKAIKKLDLSLERDILCYRHAAAATLEQSAGQARIFESNERSILSKSSLKQGTQGWAGVEAYGSVTRTCDLDIPRGHATVKCGKYFEVRYFLNLCVSTSHSKIVSVQLPIILVHMNSLDVVPNSVAQVAAAIEEKRSHHRRGRSHATSDHTVKRHSRSQTQTPISPAKPQTQLNRHASKLQGRAFAISRQQSLDRSRTNTADLQHLGAMIDSSPKKHLPSKSPSRHRGKHANADANNSGVASKANPMIVSRPAREIHKQPSNLSLGGISVGSYTIFNDSSTSGTGMEYVTPPSKRKGRIFDFSMLGGSSDNEKERAEILKVRHGHVRSTHSVDSVRSRKSSVMGKSRWRDHFVGAKKERMPDHRQIRSALGHRSPRVDSHTLGLTSHVTGHLDSPPLRNRSSIGRPSRDGAVGMGRVPSWRIRGDSHLDRSRFEFKAVKKEGGGFKEWLGGLRVGKHEAARKDNWL